MREVHLRRVEPERNMARFYTLSVEMALFENWSCTRTFGRIGAGPGRIMIGLYPDREQALAALSGLLRRKRKRGYAPVGEIPPAL